MATLGRYETLRELNRHGAVSVWLAQVKGSQEQVVIKIVRSEGVASGEVQEFLETAQIQQKVAGSSPVWAAILEIGQTDEGAYSVMPNLPRSVERLVLGKARLDAETLYLLFKSVIEGLVALEKAADRPHGNLKSTNIRLEEAPKGKQPQAYLTDPLPGLKGLDQGRVDDLRAIGQLIYELVLLQPFRRGGGWPVPQSPEWQRLGGYGSGWRALCDRLLDPDLAKKGLSLQALVEEELPKLEPKAGQTPWGKLAAAAVLVALIGVGSYFFYRWIVPEPSVPFDGEKWRQICRDYSEWFGKLYSDFQSHQIEDWDGDPHLKVALAELRRIERERIEFDPRVIVGRPGVPSDWAIDPPLEAREDEAVRKTQDAVDAIDKIRKQLEGWPVLTKLQLAADRYAHLGWKQQAEHLRQLWDGARPVEGLKSRIADGVGRIRSEYERLGGEAYFDRVEALYAQVEIEGVTDELSAAFGSYVGKYLGQAGQQPGVDSLAALRNRLEELAALKPGCDRLGQSVAAIGKGVGNIRKEFPRVPPNIQRVSDEVDQIQGQFRTSLELPESLSNTGPVRKVLASAEGRLKQLREVVEGFWEATPEVPAVDPRKEWESGSRVSLAKIAGQLKKYRQPTDTGQQFESAYRRLASESDQLIALGWTNGNKRRIEEKLDELSIELTRLEEGVGRYVSELERPPAERDPRPVVEEELRQAEQDMRELARFLSGASQAYEERIEAPRGLISGVKDLPWVVGYRETIVQAAGQAGEALNQIRGEVFSKLDPRVYTKEKWEQRIEEIEAGIRQNPNKEEAEKLSRSLASCRSGIESLDQEPWNAGNRKRIEQRHDEISQKLDEIAKQVVVDPRGRLNSRWADIASRIQQLRKFRAELGDPQLQRFDDRWRNIETKKQALDGRPEPVDPDQMAALNDAAKEIENECEKLFQDLDPRKLWDPQPMFEEIQGGLYALEMKDPAKGKESREALEALLQETSRVRNRPWKWEEANELMSSISGLRERVSKLRNSVITDPRDQINWDTVAAQIEAELKLLDPQVRPELTEKFEIIRGDIQELTDIPWRSDREAEVKDKITSVVQSLRAVYVGAVQGAPGLAGASSGVADAVWMKQRDALIQSVSGLEELLKKTDQARASLVKICGMFAQSVPEVARPRGWDEAAAQQAIAKRRDSAIAEALSGWRLDRSGDPVVDASAQEGAVGRYAKWYGGVERMLREFKAAEQALDQVMNPDEPVARGMPTLRSLMNYWFDGEGRPMFEEFRVAVGESLTGRLASLEQIDRADGRQTLLALAQQGQTALDPAVTVAAWRRLGGFSGPSWPGDLEELQQEFAINRALAAMITSRVDDAARESGLQEEISRERYRRWLIGFTQVTKDVEGTGVDKAIGLFSQAEMDWRHESLPAWARYNILLSRHRALLREMKANADSRDVKERVSQFLAEADPLIQQGVRAEGLRDALQALLTNGQGGKGPVPLDEVGPKASMMWDAGQWEERVDTEGGRWIEYSWSPRGSGVHRLRFVRVEGGQQVARPFYVCTTEVSLGLFKAVVDAAGAEHWQKIDGLLKDYTHWRGPRVWRKKRKGITENKTWNEPLPPLKSSGGKYDDYAKNIQAGKPDESYPMQYVSADAALYFASMLGCRLPTSEEWKLACEVELEGRDVESYVGQVRPNLRDKTWLEQYNHFKEIKGQLVESSVAPYSGSFWANNKDSDIRQFDDGALWFKPVATGGGAEFQHLVGNVAEWVLDGATYTVDDALAEVGEVLRSGQLGVIGGSAQSPPSVGIATMESAAGATDAYSDVGIRLTFSSPSPPLISQVNALLAQQAYLSGGAE